jgi:hypothetical protein
MKIAIERTVNGQRVITLGEVCANVKKGDEIEISITNRHGQDIVQKVKVYDILETLEL